MCIYKGHNKYNYNAKHVEKKHINSGEVNKQK
jgi:hypothetical protein